MSSLKERAKTLPFVEVEGDGEFLIKIKYDGVEMANVIMSFSEIIIHNRHPRKVEVKFTATYI